MTPDERYDRISAILCSGVMRMVENSNYYNYKFDQLALFICNRKICSKDMAASHYSIFSQMISLKSVLNISAIV